MYDRTRIDQTAGVQKVQTPYFCDIEPVGAPEISIYEDYFKRALDIVIVLLSAPVVLPVCLILILLIRRDGGPAFFSQTRIGRDGKPFTCWKLRSMVPQADDMLKGYLSDNPEARLEWDEYQKLKNDPRITGLGRFMRSSSLDELPQLWCVLKGDMSLVGPRPFLPEQEPLYAGRTYYDLRPGITGLWQVNGHNDTCFAERETYDENYGKSVSLWSDICIMFRTVFVMFRGEGV